MALGYFSTLTIPLCVLSVEQKLIEKDKSASSYLNGWIGKRMPDDNGFA